MNPTVEALLAALVGVDLCVLWNVEHEYTSIRAPWTGLTLGASAAAFIAAGVVGRGWRAVVVCAAFVAGTLGIALRRGVATVWNRGAPAATRKD
jgi:hypothetical protein